MGSSAPRPERAVAGLFPGYFALVMATGIVAIGAEQENLHWLASPLALIAAAAHAVLAGLLAARLVLYPGRVVADLTSHARGFAFLTVVAATNVLGSAAGVVWDRWGAARALWWVSLPLWAILVYVPLVSAVLRHDKPGLGAGINGTWFLVTVATQSVASLGALLLPHGGGDLLAFTCLAAFGLGFVVYVIVMTMVFLRWTFQPLEPTEADPPAWIAAGAVAITVLAGSNLLAVRPVAPRLTRVAPFLEGLVVSAWATATFWFPLMVAIGVWRHIARRLPLRYHPSYWALVFPLGMYGAATFRMRAAVGLDGLAWLPKAALAVALICWAAAFTGMAAHGATSLRRRTAARSEEWGGPA